MNQPASVSRASHARSENNTGYLCTDAICRQGAGDRLAMRYYSPAMERTDITYDTLRRQSNQFANVLRELGFAPGDIFFIFLPKAPEQYFSILGTLKSGCIAGLLFANMGEDSLLDRLGDSQAKGILTRRNLLRRLTPILPKLPNLKHILILEEPDGKETLFPVESYALRMREASSEFTAHPADAATPSLLHYTSGSTGKPKGALHVHGAAVLQTRTAREILTLRPGDTYWCTADAGWVTGTSYGIIGPWSIGVTQIHFGGAYNPEQWFQVMQDERVNVWYTAPTVLRMLMREEDSFYQKFDLSALRDIFSVGEPLNPEVVHWCRRVLKREAHDTWFQTETGAIMIANRPPLAVRPGSMGLPVDGIEPAILSPEGAPLPAKTPGRLCLKAGWPSMFATYLNHPEIYEKKFQGGYYDSGDQAYQDEDGYYWFIGRGDDVINTAGHLISPFEIESALLEIPEVAEGAAIGVPDEILFEKVAVYVALRKETAASPELELKIRLYLSNRLSTIATPQQIFFVDGIPKNKAGKIMRRVLKARYLGADMGDISTLEV